MRSPRPRYFRAGLLLALACLVLPPAHAQIDRDGVDGDAYGPHDCARVRFEENGPTILRAETVATREAPSTGQLNAPIFSGDSVATNAEQRAEIQLAGGSVIRIDQSSRVVFTSLSYPHREIRDPTVLQLAEGNLRVEAAIDEPDAIRVDTAACAVHVLGDADVRIEIRGDRTYVSSRRGIVEIDAGGGALVVQGGMATEVLPGEAPLGARPFNTFRTDDFDHWGAAREKRSAVVNDAASPSNPVSRRPLVHSDRDKMEGASERWKGVYRQMAQPRPTRLQAPPAAETPREKQLEKPATDDSSHRDAP